MVKLVITLENQPHNYLQPTPNLLGLNGATFNVGTDTASVDNIVSTTGNAWEFGSGNYVQFPSMTVSTEFSASAWVKTTDGDFMILQDTSNNGIWLGHEMTYGNGWRVGHSQGGSDFNTSTASNDGTWHHVVWNVGTPNEIFIDGVSIGDGGSAPTSGSWSPVMGGTGMYDINTGRVDDVGIWDRFLTNTEITSLYTGTSPSSITSGLVASYNFEQTSGDLLDQTNSNDGVNNGSVNQNEVGITTPSTNTIVSATGLTDNTSTPQHYAITNGPTQTTNHKVHTFTSGGTFQVTSGSGDIDYLIVAGGGGGGASLTGLSGGGGGGAGGLLQGTEFAVTAQSYSITVGTGAGNAATTSLFADNGNDSTFGGMTAIGGGGGATGGNTATMIPQDGGSGGGQASYQNAGASVIGQGTVGQGNDGGAGHSANYLSGGGGGSGSVGLTGILPVGGDGGDGLSSSITGTTTLYAAGGGGGIWGIPGHATHSGPGGAGGSGIGGDGGLTGNNPGSDATGYGSGGGGASIKGGAGQGVSQVGGAGSDGIIIIKYLDDGSITATGGTVTTLSEQVNWNIYQNGVVVGSAFDTTTSLGANSVAGTATQSSTNENTNVTAGECSGQAFDASATIYGKTITSFDMDLRRNGSETGTLQMGVFDGQTCDVKTLFRTIDATTLPTSYASYSSGTGSHTIATGEVVGIKWATGSGSEIKYASQNTEVYDGTNSYNMEMGSALTTRDAKFTINYAEVSDYTTNLSGSLDEFFINSDALTQTEITNISVRGIDAWSILPNPNDYPLSQTELPNDSADETSTGYIVTSTATSNVDGTNSGVTTGVTGKIGNAWSFDGSDDYVSIGTVSDLNLLHDGTANTLSFWFKKTTAETNDVRTVLHSSDGSGNGFEVFYLDRSSSSEDRKIKIEVVNTSGQQVGIYYAQQAFPNDTDWHHYTIVSDVTNSILKLYVDGVKKQQIPAIQHLLARQQLVILLAHST